MRNRRTRCEKLSLELLFIVTQFEYAELIAVIFIIIADLNRVAGPTPVNGSPRSSIRSTHSSKAVTPPPSSSVRNGTIILDSLTAAPKPKVRELENNNSSRIVNKNNASKVQQQVLQQLIDQQQLENQKQVAELMHANKGVEALGVLVQYLVFNVSTLSEST